MKKLTDLLHAAANTEIEKDPRAMDTTTGIRALTREEIEEALADLKSVEGYLGGLVYRDAVHAIALISAIREVLGGCVDDDASEWTEWDGGGPCPVDAGTYVDIVRRDGEELWGQRAGIPGDGLAAPTFWRSMNHPSDIVRYRISSLPARGRSDAGLNIQTKHLDIRTAAETPDG